MAAAVWIGGMVFIALVLVPVIRRPETRAIAASLVHLTGLRFRSAGWACLVLIFLTGGFNLFYRGLTLADLWNGQVWGSSFGVVLAGKLVLFSAVILLSCVHDFAIGPRATALWREDPSSERANRLRRQASWIGRVNLLLALVLVALGLLLVRGVPG